MYRMHSGRVCKTVLGLSAGAVLLLVLWPAWRLGSQETGAHFPGLRANLWPQADRLFHTDPRWLGGDAAYSVNLGGGRVLWLFGDSFIAKRGAASRKQSTMVRNSVAIETGYDPSKASLKFYWGSQAGRPASFAPETGDTWLWPTDGVRIGKKLLLFFTRVRTDTRKDSLGFENVGWTAFFVDNPDQEPSAWVMRRIATPANPWNVIVGAAAVAAGNNLYVFSPAEPSHHVYLLRWPLSTAANGDLRSPEWWCGSDQGWTPQQDLACRPVPVFTEGSMEFSVQWDPQRKKFLEVQSVGFGASEIAVRWAQRLEGPWSEPRQVFRPPESDRPDAFVYATKAHPELIGAELVITYVANCRDFGTLVRDLSIYYPRFVRLWLSPR